MRAIAPFLRLDHDPYLVISDGRMFWMQDAYTTSDYFPDAKPAPGHDLNYIRNSVKVVIDAYNGTIELYLVDPADPIAATFQRIFPSLFKPFTAMPRGFAEAHSLSRGPLPDPGASCSRLITWIRLTFSITARICGNFRASRPATALQSMAPYYIIMRLPEEPQAEFFVMLPMVPSGRDNMIAWLAARCDAPNYGKLIVYEFPKEKLVYGPLQIEARINQNTEISQQISLWNQMGSRVIRGNLLVIPIEDFHSVCFATVSSGNARTLAGAQARDRSVWRARRDEGDARRGIIGSIPGARRRAGATGKRSGSAVRRSCGRSGTQSAGSLQSSNGALEIRRLDGLRHRPRGDAWTFRGS